jgi:hypothetical protein
MASLMPAFRLARMPRAAAPAMLVLLAACGTAGGWSKPGADPQAIARDSRECRAQADQVLARDRSIDQDILATRGPDWQRAGTFEPHSAEMREQEAAHAKAVFEDCMHAKGYARHG